MKELTIEEKAQHYDAAINRANSLLSGNQLGNAWVYKVLPELKESEDERIRKEIIQFLKLPHPQFVGNRNYEKWIDYLEKQGEQKPVEPQQNMLSQEKYAKAVDECIYGEQKPADKVEPKFKAGDIIRHKEQGFTCKITAVDTEYRVSECNGTHLPFDAQDAYELVEQNFTWSEEDEKAINDIMWIIEAYRKNGFNETHIQMADSSEIWLKSIKGKYTWKPSDEQMVALEYYMHTLVCNSYKETLFSLYQDLKKLREK